ncbi:MAG: AMP-dependent synthetase/ligase [Caldimonas sp.]
MTELHGAHGDDPRDPAGETLPRLLRRRAAEHPARDFLRAKRHGVWAALGWADALARVEALARAMMTRGVGTGDVVAVIGENRPEAYLVQYAALCTGAAATHLYPDASAAELGYVLQHSGARLLFAEDQEQVDKFLDTGAAGAGVAAVVYLDDRGLWHYANPLLLSFAGFLAGAPDDAAARALLDARVAAGTDEDLAALCYTSGTTGQPKGVRLTHRFLLDNAYRLIASFGIAAHIDYFSYISPAWGAEQITGIGLGLLAPAVVHFAEKPETVAIDMREISPEFLLFTPRQWEMIASSIEAQMLDARPWRQRLYQWAISASPQMRWLAEALVLRAVRDNLGLGQARFPISGGSGLSAEIFRRFHALGIPLRNLYGSTEAGLVSAHWGEEAEPSTLGRPLKISRSVGAPLHLRISVDGELLVRGGSGFAGYHGDAAATNKVLDDEGFFHTGDAMHVPESGELVFLDRVKDMRQLAGGNRFPPQTIENHLRASPYLRDAIVLGDETRGFVAALLNVDSGIFGRYLERRNIGWGTFAELSQLDAVLERIALEVARVNAMLPQASRIARFATLPKELDADDAELTRSRKLKRDVIASRYATLIESVYAGDESCKLTVSVVYQDGTVGTVHAGVRILSTGHEPVAA